jgi:hypothetical protein
MRARASCAYMRSIFTGLLPPSHVEHGLSRAASADYITVAEPWFQALQQQLHVELEVRERQAALDEVRRLFGPPCGHVGRQRCSWMTRL